MSGPATPAPKPAEPSPTAADGAATVNKWLGGLGSAVSGAADTAENMKFGHIIGPIVGVVGGWLAGSIFGVTGWLQTILSLMFAGVGGYFGLQTLSKPINEWLYSENKQTPAAAAAPAQERTSAIGGQDGSQLLSGLKPGQVFTRSRDVQLGGTYENGDLLPPPDAPPPQASRTSLGAYDLR